MEGKRQHGQLADGESQKDFDGVRSPSDFQVLNF
jgi:hypothetical protein